MRFELNKGIIKRKMAGNEKTKIEEKNDEDYFNPYDDIPEFMSYSPGKKLLGFWKENPYIPIGLAGALGIFLYGVRNSKHRGPGRDGLQYFLHYRIYVQGFFALTLAAGCVGKTAVDIYRLKQRGEIKGIADFIKRNQKRRPARSPHTSPKI